MNKRRIRRIAWLFGLTSVLGVFGWGFHATWYGGRDFAEIQARVGRWGGYIVRVPNRGRLEPLRDVLGNNLVNVLSGSEGNQVGACDTDPTKDQLAEVLAAQPLTWANFGGARNLDDDWVAGIRSPSAMVSLHLDATGVTDRSVDKFLRMTELVELGLVETSISDASIDRLRLLPKLQRLSVGGPKVRSIRLVGPQVVDDQGRPAVRTSDLLFVRGHVDVDATPGSPGPVRVMIRAPGGNPPCQSVPYGWNANSKGVGLFTQAAPGRYDFEVDMPGLPSGELSVEVWVEWIPVAGPPQLFYRLEPFAVRLGPKVAPEIRPEAKAIAPPGQAR